MTDAEHGLTCRPDRVHNKHVRAFAAFPGPVVSGQGTGCGRYRRVGPVRPVTAPIAVAGSTSGTSYEAGSAPRPLLGSVLRKVAWVLQQQPSYPVRTVQERRVRRQQGDQGAPQPLGQLVGGLLDLLGLGTAAVNKLRAHSVDPLRSAEDALALGVVLRGQEPRDAEREWSESWSRSCEPNRASQATAASTSRSSADLLYTSPADTKRCAATRNAVVGALESDGRSKRDSSATAGVTIPS